MKSILLGLSISLALLAPAFADNRPTLESTEAAIKAGRTAVSNKTAELENKVKARDIPAAQNSAANLLDLMKQGMNQTRMKLDLQSGDRKKQEETNAHYLKMEMLTHEFQLASTNVSSNGAKLVDYAKRYLAEY